MGGTYVCNDCRQGEHKVHSDIACFAVALSILAEFSVDLIRYQYWLECGITWGKENP